MSLVKAFFQHREDGTELVEHEVDIKFHREACEIIDNFPWVTELELTEQLGEGGGFFFLLGDFDGKYAGYQYTPTEERGGLLDLEVVYKPSFLNIFGRGSLSVSFDYVSTEEAKQKIKELFEYSIDSLYKKYKK